MFHDNDCCISGSFREHKIKLYTSNELNVCGMFIDS